MRPQTLALSTLALALLGCGGTGGTARDAGPADTGAPDAAETAPGVRAFEVFATAQTGTIGGMSMIGLDNRLTLLLDFAARRAVVGSAGTAQLVPLSINDADGSFSFTTPFATRSSGGACGGFLKTVYDTLELTIMGDRLVGRATGRGLIASTGSEPIPLPFTATLEGAPDTTAPFLIVPPGSSPPDLMSPFVIWASEPLPASATARLVGSDGTVVTLAPDVIPGAPPLVVSFTKPDITLPAGEGFQVVLDAAGDLAGNPPLAGDALRIAGFPDAPLLPPDGFESVTGLAVAGAGVVRDGPGAPITGTASVYIGGNGAPPPGGDVVMKPELTVRLAIPPGATKMTFAYRQVFAMPAGAEPGEVQLGSVGRQPGPVVKIPAAKTGTSVMWGFQTVTQSDVATMDVALPADRGGELVVALRAGALSCNSKSAVGLLVDDLRVE